MALTDPCARVVPRRWLKHTQTESDSGGFLSSLSSMFSDFFAGADPQPLK